MRVRANKMSHVMRKPDFCLCKKKAQISCAVIAQLISAFVFAILIVPSLFFLNLKFQAFSLLLRLYRTVCVRPGWKPNSWFSHVKAQMAIAYSVYWSVGYSKYMSMHISLSLISHVNNNFSQNNKHNHT